ncbi:MAG: DUF2889 domain-containing protein [Thiothrix sp.]|nr:DUF2889 domain-containing protein [Thiothrix sp.]HPQ95385.1 DUF2889 domain-containing protein [Thiolinea sp.]
MPLSPPQARQLIHTRTVTCQGYEREDGLWDIEGHMVDTKSYSFPNRDRGGRIQAGEPLHGMRIRLTIDTDLLIHAAEQSTDFAPHAYCHEVPHFVHGLVGQRIGPGWTQRCKNLMGGSSGCTHITELLGPMATTAYQTLVKVHFRKTTQPETAPAATTETDSNRKPRFIGSCHALQESSPVVRDHYPHCYRAPAPETGAQTRSAP